MDFRGKRIFFNFIGAILMATFVIAGFFSLVHVVFNIVYLRTNVYQFSMYPTINSGVSSVDEKGDTVYINRFAPYLPGDIVVAEAKTWGISDGKYVIKRLIAMPNDEFYIQKDEDNLTYNLIVNGSILYSRNYSALEDDDVSRYYSQYLTYMDMHESSVIEKDGQKLLKMHDDEYFLMGDNWGNTLDSLSRGPIGKKSIVGKVELIVDVRDNVPVNVFKFIMKKVFCV